MTDCLAIALSTIIGIYHPIDLAKVREIVGWKIGRWTWPFKMIKWLIDNGYDLEIYDEFKPLEFQEDAEKYLKKYHPESFYDQKSNSDLAEAMKDCKEIDWLSPRISYHQRQPRKKDFEYLLFRGFHLITMTSNSHYKHVTKKPDFTKVSSPFLIAMRRHHDGKDYK